MKTLIEEISSTGMERCILLISDIQNTVSILEGPDRQVLMKREEKVNRDLCEAFDQPIPIRYKYPFE